MEIPGDVGMLAAGHAFLVKGSASVEVEIGGVDGDGRACDGKREVRRYLIDHRAAGLKGTDQLGK